jgi:hypothetical protein
MGSKGGDEVGAVFASFLAKSLIVPRGTPLCPAEHLPLKGGDRRRRAQLSLSDLCDGRKLAREWNLAAQSFWLDKTLLLADLPP